MPLYSAPRAALPGRSASWACVCADCWILVEADQRLLLAILSAHRVAVDHSRVAHFVGCSARACEERLKKLRRKAKDRGYDFSTAPTPEPRHNPRARRARGRFWQSNGDGAVKMQDGRYMKLIKREVNDHPDEIVIDNDDAPLINRYQEVPEPRTASVEGFATTAMGVEIPLGVPLQVSVLPLVGSVEAATGWRAVNHCGGGSTLDGHKELDLKRIKLECQEGIYERSPEPDWQSQLPAASHVMNYTMTDTLGHDGSLDCTDVLTSPVRPSPVEELFAELQSEGKSGHSIGYPLTAVLSEVIGGEGEMRSGVDGGE